MSSHSPLPWRTGSPEGHVWSASRLVAGCMGHQDNFTAGVLETNKANAEHIVRCVNAHGALVTALKESNKFWTDLEGGLVQAAERGFSKIDVGDLLTAVRHVLAIEGEALKLAESKP